MRIAVDVSPLSHPRTGIGNYLRGMVAGLATIADTRHEVVAFAPTSKSGAERVRAALQGLPVDLRLTELPLAHAWRVAWSRLGVPAVERFLGPVDVLHFSDWMYPPQRDGVRATTVHDLIPIYAPETCDQDTARVFEEFMRRAMRHADHILAVSEHTAADVRRYAASLGVPTPSITVTRNGSSFAEFLPKLAAG